MSFGKISRNMDMTSRLESINNIGTGKSVEAKTRIVISRTVSET